MRDFFITNAIFYTFSLYSLCYELLCNESHINQVTSFLRNPLLYFPVSQVVKTHETTMKATLVLFLLAQVSWAGPFEQRGLFDFMLEDEASGIIPYDPDNPLISMCPYRCQCHLRVVQCSDLGKWVWPSLCLFFMELNSLECLALSGLILQFQKRNKHRLMRSRGNSQGENELALRLGPFRLSTLHCPTSNPFQSALKRYAVNH